MIQVNFKILKKWFIHLKLTGGAVVSPLIIRLLLWLCLTISWSLGVCSIRNFEKTWVLSIMYHYRGTWYSCSYCIVVSTKIYYEKITILTSLSWWCLGKIKPKCAFNSDWLERLSVSHYRISKKKFYWMTDNTFRQSLHAHALLRSMASCFGILLQLLFQCLIWMCDHML